MAIRDPELAQGAIGLGRSLSLIGDMTRRCVVTDLPQYDWRRYFDLVVRPRDICFEGIKSVIWLDPRSLAFARTDKLFEQFRGEGVVLQGRPLDKGPEPGFAYVGLDALSAEQKSLVCGFVKNGTVDVASMHRAMRVKVLPPGTICNALGERLELMQLHVLSNQFSFFSDRTRCAPPIFSAVSDLYSREYRQQLSSLKWASRYEDEHPFGHMSFSHRFSRSVQRRLLKLSGRLG